mmetsp:Transcript_51839/g.105375  ORF Transcript_51839/g.105375 Transcript_51839/m.105375 type:complete len:320 (+) Transcript_51839:1129-2088(+)
MERWDGLPQQKDQDPHSEHVRFLAIVHLLFPILGSMIQIRAHRGSLLPHELGGVLRLQLRHPHGASHILALDAALVQPLHQVGTAQVDDDHLSVLIDQEVVRFEISMSDAILAQLGHAVDDAMHQASHGAVRHGLALGGDEVEELAVGDGLHDHNVSGRVPTLTTTTNVGGNAHVGDDIGMLKHLKGCFFQKLQLAIIVPRQKLHDIAMPCRLVCRQVGLAKGPGAQEIIQSPPLAKDGEGSGTKPWVMAPFALELLGAPRDHPQTCSLHDGNARGTFLSQLLAPKGGQDRGRAHATCRNHFFFDYCFLLHILLGSQHL